MAIWSKGSTNQKVQKQKWLALTRWFVNQDFNREVVKGLLK